MKFSRTGRLISLFFFFLCLSWSGNIVWGQNVQQTKIVEVIGTGQIYHDKVASARDKAIEHGLWNAVEEGVGLLISPAVVVSHFQLLSEHIYTQFKDFIHDYKVLTESKAGSYYRVVVQATLLIDVLHNKLQDIGVLLTEKELPRVVLLLTEKNVGHTWPRYTWKQNTFTFMKLPLTVEDTLERTLKEKGFAVLAPETLSTQETSEGRIPDTDLSDEMAAELARQLGADVVIIGEAFAQLTGNISGTGTKSVEAKVSLRALKVDNGKIIGSFNSAKAAVHANETVAGTKALALATSDIAKDIIRQITASWGRGTRQTVLVQLVVKGIREYVDFVKFRKTLRDEIAGIKNVYLRTIKTDEAEIDVNLQGNTSALAEELILKNFEGFGVNILEVKENSITLELIPKVNFSDDWQRPTEVESETW